MFNSLKKLVGVVHGSNGTSEADLVLSDDERVTLERWSRLPTSAQALAQRSRIVRGSATGASNQAVAKRER